MGDTGHWLIRYHSEYLPEPIEELVDELPAEWSEEVLAAFHRIEWFRVVPSGSIER